MADFPKYTFIQDHEAILAGRLRVPGIVERFLERIHKYRHLNAFIESFDDEALDRAREIDKKIRSGRAGKLAGLVLGVKDNIAFKNHRLSAASGILEGYVSPYHATVVERLLAEDAIIIGRTNCDEFAMGSTNDTSFYGKVLNPLNEEKVPGGSSGGSASAVAAGLCHAALGSDTGGSIRLPAAFCGITGLKPGYGRVSRYGLIAYGSSLDQIGPMAHTIEDLAALLEVMAGHDPKDSTSSPGLVPDYNKPEDPKEVYKIAFFRECMEHPGLDRHIRTGIRNKIDRLKNMGHLVDKIEFPWLDYLVPCYYILATAEASSNLARYDGVHYGFRARDTKTPAEVYQKSRSQGFGKEVKRRIMTGTFVLSAGYYDAYYKKAQEVRQLIREQTRELFNKYDFILSPTSPNTAFLHGAFEGDPVALYLEDIYTIHANLAGTPAISIPAGIHPNGLPYGMQLMAAPLEEHKLLAFSRSLLKKD